MIRDEEKKGRSCMIDAVISRGKTTWIRNHSEEAALRLPFSGENSQKEFRLDNVV